MERLGGCVSNEVPGVEAQCRHLYSEKYKNAMPGKPPNGKAFFYSISNNITGGGKQQEEHAGVDYIKVNNFHIHSFAIVDKMVVVKILYGTDDQLSSYSHLNDIIHSALKRLYKRKMAQAQVIALPIVVSKLYRNLCLELCDVESTVSWCQRFKLLARQKNCPRCGKDMQLLKRKDNPEQVGWRCPRKACRSEVTLRSGTFFVVSRLPIEKIVRILHLWSSKTRVGKMMVEAEICNKMAIDWYNFTRDVCAQYFIDWRTWS